MKEAEHLHTSNVVLTSKLEAERKATQQLREALDAASLAQRQLQLQLEGQKELNQVLALRTATQNGSGGEAVGGGSGAAAGKGAAADAPADGSSELSSGRPSPYLSDRDELGVRLLDRDEIELRLKQRVLHCNQTVETLKLSEMKLEHQVTTVFLSLLRYV